MRCDECFRGLLFDFLVFYFFCSLDPDGDPLCVLLMIDFYALRSEQYTFLIRMYEEWEVRNF